MANENETVKQLCDYLANNDNSTGEPIGVAMPSLADRVLAAHNREIAAKDAEINNLKWKVENYAQVVAVKDAEIAKLKADVQELHDALREAVIETCHNHACCGGAPEYNCNGVDGDCFVKRWRAALAKAAGEEVAK